VKRTAILGIIGAFLVGAGGVVFFTVGLGCSTAGFTFCNLNGQNIFGNSASVIGFITMVFGFLLFVAVYEHEYSQKWAWWREE